MFKKTLSLCIIFIMCQVISVFADDTKTKKIAKPGKSNGTDVIASAINVYGMWKMERIENGQKI